MNIWLPVNEALEKFKQYRYLITAVNYIPPFNTVSEHEVQAYFKTDEKITIFSQTPSVGDIWSTHPSYKYTSSSKQLFGRDTIFCKVSNEHNVEVEFENLKKMLPKLSVPTPISVIKNEGDLSELLEMKPNCKIGAILTEEFIHSISIGRALIEEGIDIESLVDAVLSILMQMHEFSVHKDLKQSHVRICLDPEICRRLTFGYEPELELSIRKVSIIDVETACMKTDLTVADFSSNIDNDIRQLLVSLIGYLTTLEHQSESLKNIFPMPISTRLDRFKKLLNRIADNYEITPPFISIDHSKTLKFFLEFYKTLK